MQKALIGFVIVALLLVGCDKSPTPAVSSGGGYGGGAASYIPAKDALQRKLQELAGNGATDCGRLKTQAQDQMATASTCAMGAAKKKQAFYVAYELPGLTVALAGNSDGKLFSVQLEQPEKAGSSPAAEPVAAPCPSELRIAQSGRVTCTAPGAMGAGSMGGASPHGGAAMPPASGASPHGGMSMPPGAAPNPHGGAGGDLSSGHSKSAP